MDFNEAKAKCIKKFDQGAGQLLNYLVEISIIYIESGEYKLSPDLDLLYLYEKFLQLYRRDKKDKYLEIAKICRRAAHKIYRILLRKKITKPNTRYLNLVD